jgi:hypothetical protein
MNLAEGIVIAPPVGSTVWRTAWRRVRNSAKLDSKSEGASVGSGEVFGGTVGGFKRRVIWGHVMWSDMKSAGSEADRLQSTLQINYFSKIILLGTECWTDLPQILTTHFQFRRIEHDTMPQFRSICKRQGVPRPGDTLDPGAKLWITDRTRLYRVLHW